MVFVIPYGIFAAASAASAFVASPAGQRAAQRIGELLLAAALAVPAWEVLKDLDDAPPSSQQQQGEVVTAPDAALSPDLAAAAVSFLYDIVTSAEYVRRYLKRPRKKGKGVQYRLFALEDDDYIHFNLGRTIPLKQGDTWKYGETMQWDSPSQTQRRYTRKDLRQNVALGKPVEFQREFEGTQNKIKAEEYKKIIKYKKLHGGRRPPGNKVDR